MYRLNKKALAILRAEVIRCGNGDMHTNKREQVLKRFDRLSLDVGKRATIDELCKQVVDIFPIFSEHSEKNIGY